MIIKNKIISNFIINDLRQFKKFPKAVKRDGLILVLRVIKRTYYYRLFNKLANFKTDINSERYWDVRLRRNWDQSGGDVQTRQFAIGLIPLYLFFNKFGITGSIVSFVINIIGLAIASYMFHI